MFKMTKIEREREREREREDIQVTVARSNCYTFSQWYSAADVSF